MLFMLFIKKKSHFYCPYDVYLFIKYKNISMNVFLFANISYGKINIFDNI